MTKNISEEELLLRKRARRRLLGAVTLVIAAVIILPMIFDEEPKLEQQEIAINIPSEEVVTDFSPTLLDADNLLVADSYNDKPTEPLSVETIEPPSPYHDEDLIEELVKRNLVPIPDVKPSYTKIVSEKNSIASHASTATGLLEFVVQLGAFSDHSKARQQQQNLVSNGVQAYTEMLYVNNKEMMRVRVGPFSTRISAENELRKLNQLGLNGVVTAR